MSKRIIRIYDCSNSDERPYHNPDNMGPAENDIMRDLKKYAKIYPYDFEFVNDVNDAIVVITNDVFPSNIKNRSIFKVKRMDGIYWQNELTYRNKALNDAALEADLVIFISEFSKNCFPMLDKLKDYVVILNNVDTSIFKKQPITDKMDVANQYRTFTWAASASNWKREEKRFQDLLMFAEKVAYRDRILLIGKCDYGVPNNVIKFGYVESDVKKAEILNSAKAFINLSYRDAGSKVTCQALACGLPVLYARSGGVPELVEEYGAGISIYDTNDNIGVTPQLSIDDIKYSYLKFRNEFDKLNEYIKEEVYGSIYEKTIGGYFRTIRRFIEDKK